MKTLLLALFSLLSLAGCSRNAPTFEPASPVDTVVVKGKYQYLALGDSYTIGQSVNLSESFPYQLKAQLGQKGYSVADLKIIAVTGWTTANLINAIQQANLTQKYDIVTLLIGVNNQYQGMSQADYRTQFVQLLNTAIGFANGNKMRVFVLSIPDYSVTPFATGYNKTQIATEIDQYNAINKDESTKAGVNYLNITDISRLAATDQSLIAYDGLHPSAKMYGLWVSTLQFMVTPQLK
ncbi:SGNH/GDSL hydrolase family protein [Mucilaginibacter sp. HMF5004]|uniref:SGNH/GDSL hydrolase family protein n=1 Tax=Mucilaginibacter rivuli TaxID=2857527 RepID=UPI001C602BFA|nr:SGNH/GDSL hydrolase family protein [Mucilaginibacter rivuli]MBW4891082.1 SGNH/GDSL hydrolase family protein [Mucilaginibacter rivuli]